MGVRVETEWTPRCSEKDLGTGVDGERARRRGSEAVSDLCVLDVVGCMGNWAGCFLSLWLECGRCWALECMGRIGGGKERLSYYGWMTE